MQSDAWNYIKKYCNDNIDSVKNKFILGDDIDDAERYQAVALYKLLNHIMDSAKKLNG